MQTTPKQRETHLHAHISKHRHIETSTGTPTYCNHLYQRSSDASTLNKQCNLLSKCNFWKLLHFIWSVQIAAICGFSLQSEAKDFITRSRETHQPEIDPARVVLNAISPPIQSPLLTAPSELTNEDRFLNHSNKESQDMKSLVKNQRYLSAANEAGRVEIKSAQLKSTFSSRNSNARRTMAQLSLNQEVSQESLFPSVRSITTIQEAGENYLNIALHPSSSLRRKLPERKAWGTRREIDNLSERIEKPDVKTLLYGFAKVVFLHVAENEKRRPHRRSSLRPDFVTVLGLHRVCLDKPWLSCCIYLVFANFVVVNLK